MNRFALRAVLTVGMVWLAAQPTLGQLGPEGPVLQSLTRESDSPPPLRSDRPDFTESAYVVGQGVIQLELGISTVQQHERLHLHALQLGEALLRWGLSSQWELRWAFPASWVQGPPEPSQLGWEDPVVGMKFSWAEKSPSSPALGWIVQTSVPWGTAGFSAGKLQPGVIFLAAQEWDSGWAWAASAQAHWILQEPDSRTLQTAFSVSVSRSLGQQASVFGEWFGFFFPESGPEEQFFHFGLTWQWGADLQWDARVGFDRRNPRGLWFAGAGVVLRWR